MNSVLNQNPSGGTQLNQAVKSSATYLINVKKLIKEHNIETEYNSFQKLKTKTTVNTGLGAAQQYYQLADEQDQTLQFESRFESGNLLASLKISDNEYDLILQNDINTNGHT